MQTDFFIRAGGKFISIPFMSVLYIEGKKNYCDIITANKKYTTYGTIGAMEIKLPENLFCRIHRSYIIALNKIHSFDQKYVCLAGEMIPLNKEGFEKIVERVILIGCDYGNKINDQIADVYAKQDLAKLKMAGI